MSWSLVKTAALPLGWRQLSYGMRGKDVAQLQSFLQEKGFYFGRVDGKFGILTEQAVLMVEKNFNLRPDGIAGPLVLATLNDLAANNRRLIHQVKPYENLRMIAQKYEVGPDALRILSGYERSRKKLYPGMRLLLLQKALVTYDENEKKTVPVRITVNINRSWQLEESGALRQLSPELSLNDYHVIEATAPVWEKLLTNRKLWPKLAAEIRQLLNFKLGFNLCQASVEIPWRWHQLLNYLCNHLNLSQFRFLVLPLIIPKVNFTNRVFWLYLPKLYATAKSVVLEPQYSLESPEAFKNSAVIRQILRQLGNLTLKTILLAEARGWLWNLEQNQSQSISLKEARFLRACHHRNVSYDVKTQFVMVSFLKRNEHYILIYRDLEGWEDFCELSARHNLLGIAIPHLRELGEAGFKLLANSFKPLTEELL